MNIIDILIPFGFFLIFLSIIALISSAQLRKKRYTLNKLNNYELEKVKIRFSQSSVGIGKVTGGMPIKAELYLGNNLILITPKDKGYFNALNNLNLPVIFVKDENLKNELGLTNIFIPDSLKISSWNSIIIKYEKAKIGKVRYDININLLEKNDIEKMNKIKNWC